LKVKILIGGLEAYLCCATEEIALVELDSFEEKWTAKYPKICIIIQAKGKALKTVLPFNN
jgi:transposase-like protein